ncbi:MAG: ankyrin repeat domain-containing protein [Wolbachia endosymbiont of Meromenopon meropis]|nr:ankyrin repeat domain-containing protein [Wolbachia endosymbiont of Meromenopon meropis]
MIIEKEKFFEIIKNVSKSEDFDENNLLQKIKNELLKKDDGRYSAYKDLKVDKMFSVLVDSEKILNYTLLHLVVECENTKVVECLLKNSGINVNETIYELDGAKSKLTALHIAASRGYQEIIQLLLDANANPLLENSEGLIPREMVCNVKNKDIIIKILKEGEIRYTANQSKKITMKGQSYKDDNLFSQHNNASLENYKNNKQILFSNSIIDKINTNKADDEILTLERKQALEEESKKQQLNKLQSFSSDWNYVKQSDLYNNYSEQPSPNNFEQSRLDLTINHNNHDDNHEIYANTKKKVNEELIECLKEHEENVDKLDSSGLTPLHFAVAESNEELTEILIENGANVNAQDKDGLTPLHYCVAARNKELVKFLIDHKANIDVQDKNNRTPLYFAAKHSYIEIVECLVDSGANVNTKDKDGYNPLYFINQYTKILKSLKLEQSGITYVRELKEKLRKSQKRIATVVDFSSKRERELNDQLNKLGQERKSLENEVEKLNREVNWLKEQQTDTQRRLNDSLKKLSYKDNSIRKLKSSNEELKQIGQTLKEEQNDIKRLKNSLAENETKLETLGKLHRKNQLLKQEIKNLRNKNVILSIELEESKNQHSKTNQISLIDEEKKPLFSRGFCISLVTISVISSIMSIASELFALSIITTAITSALVAASITYVILKPTTELKEVDIENLIQHNIGEVNL